ncbi:MAG: nucleotidyltransferase family protein [Rhizobacter sp.]|nr:nucleotidyltransferase family protein [Bacteriovorax sp.]
MSKDLKVSCLLLCAGKSSRTSPDHKLLMKIDDLSILKRTAHEIVNAQFFEVIAVAGYESEQIRDELQGLPLKIIDNESYARGMHSSIKAGLRMLSPEADYFAVCLADQPMMDHNDYNFIINTVSENKNKKLFRPMFEGKQGNPAVISKEFITEILKHEDTDKGCSYLFERYPQEVANISMQNHSTLIDVDTHELFDEVKFHLEKKR